MSWNPFTSPSSPSSDPESEYDRQKDDFYLPIVRDTITVPPRPIHITYAPGAFPSDIDPSTLKPPNPTKRTNVCAVAQSVVFWLFACSACRGQEQMKRTRKEAEMANLSIKERWKQEMENRPRLGVTARRHSMAASTHHQLESTGGSRVDVPAYVGGTIPGISSMTPNPNTTPSHLLSTHRGEGEETHADDYDNNSIYDADPRIRSDARKAKKRNYAVGSVPHPTITGAVDASTKADLEMLRRDALMMILPPPAASWQGSKTGRVGARLAMVEDDGTYAADSRIYRRNTTSQASQKSNSTSTRTAPMSRGSSRAQSKPVEPLKLATITSAETFSNVNAVQFPLPVASLPTPRSSFDAVPALSPSSTTAPNSLNPSLSDMSSTHTRPWANTIFQIATTPQQQHQQQLKYTNFSAPASPKADEENECRTPKILEDRNVMDRMMDLAQYSPTESVRSDTRGREISPMGKRSINVDGGRVQMMMR